MQNTRNPLEVSNQKTWPLSTHIQAIHMQKPAWYSSHTHPAKDWRFCSLQKLKWRDSRCDDITAADNESKAHTIIWCAKQRNKVGNGGDEIQQMMDSTQVRSRERYQRLGAWQPSRTEQDTSSRSANNNLAKMQNLDYYVKSRNAQSYISKYINQHIKSTDLSGEGGTAKLEIHYYCFTC